MPNIKQIQLPNENIYDILDSNALHESNLKSTTKSTLAAADKGSTANKEYAVGYDKNGKLSVNVPWTDNNTTYSAGDGIDITNTVIKNTGVRSISTGSSNGTISVNTNGSSANVSVKGLGNAAYTNVTDTYSSSGTAPASGKAIKNAFDTIAPMIYQGTLGTGGTITTLPTAASGNKGYVYNVITAGTYDSKSAIVGDMFVSNGSAWVLIPSGDEPTGTVTKISTGVGLTGGDITTTGTIKAKLKSETASTLDSAAMGSTANKQYAVGVDKNGYLSVNIPWTDTNTKVTTVGNHYAPTADANAELSVDASGGSTATWGTTNMVTGVNLQRDAKGHVVGVTVDSTKMPANPNTDTTYTFANGTNGFKVTPSGGSAQTVTVTPNDTTKLPLAGGTMTGVLTAKAGVYEDAYTGAINMNNSNIYGLNSIYTADASDTAGEGIHFYRDATHVDTLWMNSGDLLFVPNRTIGSGTTKADSQKVGRFTANPTSGQVVITDGTTGGMKSSGYTIAKSVPSNAVFTDTDTKVTQSSTTTTDWRKVVLGRQYGASGQAISETTDQVYVIPNFECQPSTGTVKMTKTMINNGVTLEYNSTTQSLDFIFA